MVQDEKTPKRYYLAVIDVLAKAALIAALVLSVKSCIEINKVVTVNQKITNDGNNDTSANGAIR